MIRPRRLADIAKDLRRYDADLLVVRERLADELDAIDDVDPKGLATKVMATLARHGMAPNQSRPYDDPEFGWTDPVTADGARACADEVWRICEPIRAAARAALDARGQR